MQTMNMWQDLAVKAPVQDEYLFYCKLFDDMIVGDLCSLRHRELNDRDKFSCRGCSKDTIMNSPHNRMRRSPAALRP